MTMLLDPARHIPSSEPCACGHADDDRIDAMIRRQNIRRSEPHPVCVVCGLPHHPSDSHPTVSRTCFSCGSDLLAEAAAKFIFAKSKKARKKAAKRLRRLAD